MKKAMKHVRSTAKAVYPSQCALKYANFSFFNKFALVSPSKSHLNPITAAAMRTVRISHQRNPVMKAFEAGICSSDSVPAKPERLPGRGRPGLTGDPYHEYPLDASAMGPDAPEALALLLRTCSKAFDLEELAFSRTESKSLVWKLKSDLL